MFIIWKQVTWINFSSFRMKFYFSIYFKDLIIGFSAVFWNSLLDASLAALTFPPAFSCPSHLGSPEQLQLLFLHCSGSAVVNSAKWAHNHHSFPPRYYPSSHPQLPQRAGKIWAAVCRYSSSVCQCLPESWQLQAVVALCSEAEELQSCSFCSFTMQQCLCWMLLLMTTLFACVTAALWILWRFLLARTPFHRQPHSFSLLRQSAQAFHM